MAYTCTICGETLQSDGAAGLHELVVHLSPQPSAPPPPPPPSPSERPPGAVGGWDGVQVGARRSSVGRLAVTLSVAVIGAVLAGAAVSMVVDRDRASVPTAAYAEGQTGAASAPARPGFHRVGNSDDGFSIDLPEAMTEMPLTGEGLAKITDTVGSLNPTVAGVLANNDKLLDQVRLFAIDPVSGNTQVIQRIKAGRGVDINDAPEGAFSDQYRKLGAVADEAMVQLPAGDALLVAVQVPMGSTKVSVTQYVLAHDGDVWVLTNSGPNGAKDAAEIASTFRFL